MVFHAASQVFTSCSLLWFSFLILHWTLDLVSRGFLLVGILILTLLVIVLHPSQLAQIRSKTRHASLGVCCLLLIEFFFDCDDKLVVLLDLKLLEVGARDERIRVATWLLVVLGFHALPRCGFFNLTTLHRLLNLLEEARFGSLLLWGHSSIFSLASFFKRLCCGFLTIIVVIVVESVRVIFGALDVWVGLLGSVPWCTLLNQTTHVLLLTHRLTLLNLSRPLD